MAACGERDFREMLDWAITQTPVNIALLDPQLRQLRLNTSMCRVLGLPDEAAGLGMRLTDLVSSPQNESIMEAAQTVARSGKPTVWRGVNGMPGESRDHAVEINLSPVRDPAGQVRGVLVVYPSRAGDVTTGESPDAVAPPMSQERFVMEIGEWLADEPPVVDRDTFRVVLDRVVS